VHRYDDRDDRRSSPGESVLGEVFRMLQDVLYLVTPGRDAPRRRQRRRPRAEGEFAGRAAGAPAPELPNDRIAQRPLQPARQRQPVIQVARDEAQRARTEIVGKAPQPARGSPAC